MIIEVNHDKDKWQTQDSEDLTNDLQIKSLVILLMKVSVLVNAQYKTALYISKRYATKIAIQIAQLARVLGQMIVFHVEKTKIQLQIHKHKLASVALILIYKVIILLHVKNALKYQVIAQNVHKMVLNALNAVILQNFHIISAFQIVQSLSKIKMVMGFAKAVRKFQIIASNVLKMENSACFVKMDTLQTVHINVTYVLKVFHDANFAPKVDKNASIAFLKRIFKIIHALINATETITMVLRISASFAIRNYIKMNVKMNAPNMNKIQIKIICVVYAVQKQRIVSNVMKLMGSQYVISVSVIAFQKRTNVLNVKKYYKIVLFAKIKTYACNVKGYFFHQINAKKSVTKQNKITIEIKFVNLVVNQQKIVLNAIKTQSDAMSVRVDFIQMKIVFVDLVKKFIRTVHLVNKINALHVKIRNYHKVHVQRNVHLQSKINETQEFVIPAAKYWKIVKNARKMETFAFNALNLMEYQKIINVRQNKSKRDKQKSKMKKMKNNYLNKQKKKMIDLIKKLQQTALIFLKNKNNLCNKTNKLRNTDQLELEYLHQLV